MHDSAIVRVDPSEQITIGRYEIRYHVASGGMASVFLARAVGPAGFTRPVALKRMHPHLARRREFALMFLDEARIAARINHPNVCAIHDFGEDDGAYFIAMEYLAGVPLIRLMNALLREERARRSRSDDPTWFALAARIIADAASGLHAAHELKDESGQPMLVVHRDVSPQNLFITFDGAVKVVDFGIALARDRFQETQTGTLKGKLGYMAPEQAASGPVDRRADVWALGVCLWEMLVGARLFHRNSPMETLKAVGEEAIPTPSSRRASVPKELDAIVMRALARAPADRHATARDLSRELEAFVRKGGEATGLSDLAEWMTPLFAEERAHKSDIVHTLLHGRTDEGPDDSTELRVKSATRTATDAALATRESPDERARPGSVTASMPNLEGPRVAELDTAPLLTKPEPPTVKVDALWFEEPAAPQSDPRRSRVLVGALASLAALGVVIGGGLWWLSLSRLPHEPASITRTTTPTPSAPTSAPRSTGTSSAPSTPASPSTSADPSTSTAAADLSAHADPPGTTSVSSVPVRGRRDRARLPTTVTPSSSTTSTSAAASSVGWVSVAAVGGWGEVWEGSRRLGQTPLRVQLSAGDHVLRVVPETGDERRMPVTVVGGETRRVVVSLE